MRVRNPVAAWWWVVGVCVGVRVLIPLAALGAEGRALPGLPAYDYGPFYGDANGFYATARELVSAAARAALPLAIVLAVGIASCALLARRHRAPSWVVVVVVGVVALLVRERASDLIVLVVPLAVVGALLLPKHASMATLVAPVVVTVGLYGVYKFTPLHPRFFYVVLPLVLILDAAGAVALSSTWNRRRQGR